MSALTVVAWPIAWAGLRAGLRGRPYETMRVLVIDLVLLALGLPGAFPPCFQLFG